MCVAVFAGHAGAALVAQIHDELLFEVNTARFDVHDMAARVRSIMEGATHV